MLPPVGISSLCYNKLYLFENGSLSLINWCDVFRFPLRLLVGSHQYTQHSFPERPDGSAVIVFMFLLIREHITHNTSLCYK